MAFIDSFSDAEQAVRAAEGRLEVPRLDEQEALGATVDLAGARSALAILAATDLFSENKGAGTS